GQVDAPTDGTPSILGDPTLTYAEVTAWWAGAGRGQPPQLGAPIDEVIALYLDEGEAEGVRGDLALAQAIHETGWFTSTDTSRNNFAGIAHPDGARVGQAFPDVATGVRAHIQLLKKFAASNNTQLTRPDVAPAAAARAQTWGELAGTWASSTDHWTGIAAIYDSMRTRTGAQTSTNSATCHAAGPGAEPAGQLVEVQGIVVDASIAADLDALLAAADAAGQYLTGSGYRSYDRQVELRQAHCGTSHYAIYEMPASQCSPPTARPGTSLHEQGLAIDFADCSTRSTPCWRWLNSHAARFGFYNLPSEPWHWERRP
ncbi:MAG: D-alanyl-D-alanine carboxypeptidase family protein, partial [Thermoleophilaceae bacterium]